MDKVLVTGGAGFIGSNLVEELVSRDIEVVVIDDFSTGSRDNLDGLKDDVELVKGSVVDRETVEDAVSGCDTVFHQAAMSSRPLHEEEPARGVHVNVEGFVKTVEAAIDEGVEKVVYASTSSMYGSVEPPHREDMDVRPPNLYTASKLSRERYAECYSYLKQIQTTGLRYFSVYGPHERAKGKLANVVTQFLWKMIDGEKPVIWGEGDQTRDFVFVEDVVKANIKAAERSEELDGEVFNVGTGRDVSFNRVVEELNRLLDTSIEPDRIDNPRDSYVKATLADTSRAGEILGFEAEHSFEEGLEKAVEYYRNHV